MKVPANVTDNHGPQKGSFMDEIGHLLAPAASQASDPVHENAQLHDASLQCAFLDDDISDLPPPKPYRFGRSTSAVPHAANKSIIIDQHASSNDSEDQNIARPVLDVSYLRATKSMPNLYASGYRSVHNRVVGRDVLESVRASPWTETKREVNIRVAEFDVLMVGL